jgi:hypothetical protein
MMAMKQAFALVVALVALMLAAAGEAKEVSVRFLAERVPAELGEVVMVGPEGEVSEALVLPVNHLSTPLAAPARAFKLMMSGGKVALAKVQLPEEGDLFIVVLVPAVEGGFKPVVIPSDEPGFKPGDSFIYNHATRDVMGFVGTAKFRLKPGEGTYLRPAGDKGGVYYDVAFGFEAENKENRVLSKTRWPVENHLRSYVFFFINPTTRDIDFRAVDEFVPQEEPEQ